jgi:shikimate dehydrogenase
LLGLIGAPISHSASPAMHEAAAAALNIDARYHLIDVADAGEEKLRQMLHGVRALGFSGVNVTYPYKEAVVPLLDELAPYAEKIGAVNTVVVANGRLVGHNTDATGFRHVLAERNLRLDGGPVLLLGAGGVGRAIAHALVDAGAKSILIFDADPVRARRLAAILPKASALGTSHDLVAAIPDACGLINGTPVGMSPDANSPVPIDAIRPHHWVCDAVYAPLWTPLLKGADACGATIVTGRELAIAQAVDAFRLFTGLEPSGLLMSGAFDRAIKSRRA